MEIDTNATPSSLERRCIFVTRRELSGPSLQFVADGIYAWIGVGGDSNAGAVITKNGVVAIDAQQTVALGRAFRATLEDAVGRPVARLLNTHVHLDHTAGNIAFDDVPVLAHEKTLHAMVHELGPAADGVWRVSELGPKLRLLFGANLQELVAPGSPDEAWFRQRVGGPEYDEITLKQPTEWFADRYTASLPGGLLHVEYWGPSHCDDHVVAWIDSARIAFLGDLLFVGRFPWLGDCDLEGWIRHLDRILTMDLVKVVPGHGPVATLHDVAAFRDLLAALRDAVAAAIARGCSEEAAVAEVALPSYAGMPRYREWMPFNVRATYRYLKARQG
jgi:cyclase